VVGWLFRCDSYVAIPWESLSETPCVVRKMMLILRNRIYCLFLFLDSFNLALECLGIHLSVAGILGDIPGILILRFQIPVIMRM